MKIIIFAILLLACNESIPKFQNGEIAYMLPDSVKCVVGAHNSWMYKYPVYDVYYFDSLGVRHYAEIYEFELVKK